MLGVNLLLRSLKLGDDDRLGILTLLFFGDGALTLGVKLLIRSLKSDDVSVKASLLNFLSFLVFFSFIQLHVR